MYYTTFLTLRALYYRAAGVRRSPVNPYEHGDVIMTLSYSYLHVYIQNVGLVFSSHVSFFLMELGRTELLTCLLRVPYEKFYSN